jgi:mRNA interferase YafQ
MLTPIFHNSFKKEYRLAKKRGLDISLLDDVINLLIAEIPLPAKHRNHKLQGSFSDYWECHITPDLLLTYKINKKEGCITFAHIGTHSDLF